MESTNYEKGENVMAEFWMSEILKGCVEKGMSLGEYILASECENTGQTREQALDRMSQMLDVMEQSARGGLENPVFSNSGLTGGCAHQYHGYIQKGQSILGPVLADAVQMALSCSEVNAAMGKIVACPTAGSCGIVPAAVLAVGKYRGNSREEMVQALFTASGVGMVIGEHATLAGADGGCQAECGAAAAMAAAAAVRLLGGDDEQAVHGAAMALKNLLGLVCDPVCGLVEIPCIKRNAVSVSVALTAADMACAGVRSYIPFDEVVTAMYAIGKALPQQLRETGQGGLAATKTGMEMYQRIYGQDYGAM